MDCEKFKKLYAEFTNYPIPKNIYESDQYVDWQEHGNNCQECSDWDLSQRVKRNGYNPSVFPCVHIAYEVTYLCDIHKDRDECPDVILKYLKKYRGYAILMKNGDLKSILYCPWCGKHLPEDLTEEWRNALANIGYDEPYEQDIPKEFKTDEWWRKRGL